MTKSTSKTIIGDKSKPETCVEVHSDQSVEPIVNLEMGNADRTISEEAFMNELVTIEIATTTNDNEPPTFLLSVNGTNQPMARGVHIQVKRKFVEVLARCKETRYKQPERNMSNPEAGNAMIGNTALTYPFMVHQDTPKGRAWLEAVRAEAA